MSIGEALEIFLIIWTVLTLAGVVLWAVAAAMTTKTHSKLKGKTLDPFKRARQRWEAAEYRRLQQRCYDRRKKENRPWDN